MPMNHEQRIAVDQFLEAFNLEHKVSSEAIGNALFDQRMPQDVNEARKFVEDFFKKCERRDPNTAKTIQKRLAATINETENTPLILDFIVRCRTTHLFYGKPTTPMMDPPGVGRSISSVSSQSSPFQRRSASRTRVAVLSNETTPNDHSRSRANSSMLSYDSAKTYSIGTERPMGSMRPKSPFRITHHASNSTTTTPLSASNHLFNASAATREFSPTRFHSRLSSNMGGSLSSMPAHTSGLSKTPLHSRLGSAQTETESKVCECLLAALLGIDTRLFRSDGNRQMVVSATSSISTNDLAVVQRILKIANIYMGLKYLDVTVTHSNQIVESMFSSIRYLLGEFTADIDSLRRKKLLNYSKILPTIYEWAIRLELMRKCSTLRKLSPLELLESLYVMHKSYNLDRIRKSVLETILNYTMGVFCKQMIDWMTSGEIPAENWLFDEDPRNRTLVTRSLPVFVSANDVQVLMEIGKCIHRLDSPSDEDLAAIDKATEIVKSGLNPKVIFDRDLCNLLTILRDVVCGIVMRSIVVNGRLKDHLNKATTLFFLADPRFTMTLYNVVKEYSGGLRAGTTSLSKQDVSKALATALELSNINSNGKTKKLNFRLDSITNNGTSPNISSRMQFVQPLRPKYEPTMEAMKPIFSMCDEDYEAIFHIFWSIDLARFSSQDTADLIPPMYRFLQKNYAIRENGWSLLGTISHIFFMISGTLARIRSVITVQVHRQYRRFLAAIDERCVDLDDVINEHCRFVRRVSILVFLSENDTMEQHLSMFLQTAFDAQDLLRELVDKWEDAIDRCGDDQNALKAKMAENCKSYTVKVRVLLDNVNSIQKKLTEELEVKISNYDDHLILD
ncbi:unnamed protein product [Caenorhabditis bovis]|uniref:Gamma-tubulin complex component n=1 Tax=Caenorhabditis bovis TaxID=2654633 RepID=A0A8S1EPT3_9PELO|nr:unnamed protein product [Caenorhabditis bovis]